ncbi:MAG TPA: hypothetical protein VK660_10655 [Xanthomonadaceae bacterium]|jgi:hypothetical protein|nr:hypothetical protein [Xanthomonadaceae bacterium]
MIVFELLLNGKLLARGGAADLSVLSQTLTARGVLGEESLGTKDVKESYILEAALTGLTSRSCEPAHVHLVWGKSTLTVGDELTVRIVESGHVDMPIALPAREA